MAHTTTSYDFRNNTSKYLKISKKEPVIILSSKMGSPQLVLISAEEFDKLRGIK